jgi:outer membrane protein TolC
MQPTKRLQISPAVLALILTLITVQAWIPLVALAAADAPSNDGSVSAKAGSDTAKPQEEKLEPITIANPYDEKIHDHNYNKTLHLNPLYLSTAVEMRSFEALRQEASFDQSITLRDAINYVLDHGMQIKISRESMNYQHWLTVAALGGFVPSFSMNFNVTGVNVFNVSTTSLARTFQTGISFPVFQGGGILYSLMVQRHREQAWRYVYKSTVADVFLDVYKKYTNLLQQRILLQVWAKTVEADQEQVRRANVALENGTSTRYDLMRWEAQLAADRQKFLQQGITMRQAGLQLNLAMNYPLAINLIPAEATLTEAPLFDEQVSLQTLVQDALKFSPGLRQYEQFRLCAARNIQAVASSLYPTVAFFVLYQINDATVNPPGNGAALGGAATSSIASFLDSTFAGRVSNNALGQLYSFSPTNGSTSTQGANTGPSATPAALGGTPLAAIQSGSLVSSGAVAPSIFGGGTGSGSGSNSNGSLQAPSGIFPGIFRETQAGFAMSWSLPNGLGASTAASLLASKVLARQALMQCNQELSIVIQTVHSDYLAMLAAREVIDKAAAAAAANRENLRMAKVRLENGVGTGLEVMNAQRDFITSFTSQTQAIVDSNVAQAQLLHDLGMISSATLTTGYKPGSFIEQRPTGRLRWLKP